MILAAGCGDGAGPQLTFNVTGAATCGITCTIKAVDILVLKPQGTSWCLFTSKSFVPTGERALEGLDLEPGTAIRLVMLGYCGQQCECRYDDRVVVDPAAGTLSLKLLRQAFCEKPTYPPCG